MSWRLGSGPIRGLGVLAGTARRATAKQAAFWIQSAKQEATRERRLTTLIAEAAAGRLPSRSVPPANGPMREPRLS